MATIRQEVELSFFARCSVCGSDLSNQVTQEQGNGVNTEMLIEPCATCLEFSMRSGARNTRAETEVPYGGA